MSIKSKKPISQMSTLEKQERYYPQNYAALLSDALFFSFGATLFSTENVLPLYISNLSDKPIYIALMTALFLGMSYSATVFSCVIGVNAKSPKWISIRICFLQRIGFAMILLSTFLVNKNPTLALTIFFFSLLMYACSSGMSSPLFTQMVTYSIHKNVGSFFGSYNMVCCFSGVIATSVLTYLMSRYAFPQSFTYIFSLGVISAVIATITVSLILREVTDNRVRENIKFKEVFSIGVDIFRTNGEYRRFAVTRMILGAVEFTVPYYIVFAGTLPNISGKFLGQMTTIFLISKMVASVVFGKIADRFGSAMVIRGGCLCGLVAAALAFFTKDYHMAYLMYIILAFSVNSIAMTNQIAAVEYSKGFRTPFYSAIVGVMCAPIAIVTSFFGAAIASHFSYKSIFAIAFCIYLICFLRSGTLKKKQG